MTHATAGETANTAGAAALHGACLAERAQLLQDIADLELRATQAESRAEWLRNRACLAVRIKPDEHEGDQALLARLAQMHEQISP